MDKIPPRQHVKIYCLFLIHVFEIMASGKAIRQLALILFPMYRNPWHFSLKLVSFPVLIDTFSFL